MSDATSSGSAIRPSGCVCVLRDGAAQGSDRVTVAIGPTGPAGPVQATTRG